MPRAATVALLVLLVATACGPAAPARPNVVLIVADDVGWGDLGVQGDPEVRTPRIDALARAGTRFTRAYASAPLCAPTRAGLLTGRYQNRYGYTGTTGTYPAEVRRDVGVPTDEVLLSDLLHGAGYRTGIFGKWHLGVNPHYRPTARGFDEFFGVLAGAHAYFSWGAGLFGPVMRGDQPAEGSGYLTTAITREALGFLERSRDEPFFLYVPYTAVHGPLQAPPERVARFDRLPEPRRTFAAMLEVMDDGVGALLDRLGEYGLEDRTLVIFLSDNGGVDGLSNNGALHGGKGALYEGGIRIPMFVRWPGHVPAGAAYGRPVSTLDVAATVLAAAGVPAPTERPLDGVDLLPYVRGEAAGDPHEVLFWRIRGREAALRGDDKLVRK